MDEVMQVEACRSPQTVTRRYQTVTRIDGNYVGICEVLVDPDGRLVAWDHIDMVTLSTSRDRLRSELMLILIDSVVYPPIAIRDMVKGATMPVPARPTGMTDETVSVMHNQLEQLSLLLVKSIEQRAS